MKLLLKRSVRDLGGGKPGTLLWQCFLRAGGPDALPVTQPTASKHLTLKG